MTPAAADAVVDPDRATARRWAVEELTRPEYVREQPNLVERAVTWLLDRLDLVSGLASGAGTAVALAVGLALLAIVVVVALVLAGPLRRGSVGGRRGRDGVLAGSALSAAEHRAASERAAAELRWASAVQERFRATARSLEERVVLDARPGRTADEVALEGGAALPAAAEALRAASRVFDDVTYGDRPGDEAGYRTCVAADEAARRTRPSAPTDPGTPSAPGIPSAPGAAVPA